MTRLIIELGLNHLGSTEERAWRMLHRSLECQADAVTFQVRESSFYAEGGEGRGKLSEDFYRAACERVHEAGGEFGVAVADIGAVAMLDGVGVDFWKTLSWDLQNEELAAALQNTGKPILLSTGLAGMEDIAGVVDRRRNFTLIHTQLSQAISEVNLKAIRTMKERFQVPVAFGLHCANHDVLKMALAYEPSALLFYVKEAGSPFLFDDEHAVPLDHAPQFTQELRLLESAVGDGQKMGMRQPDWVAR